MKPFPIPVVAIGPGTQTEDETLNYLAMPKGMETYRSPLLPEPEEVHHLLGARRALRDALTALGAACQDGANRCVDLNGLSDAERALINQVLGEGEVSARIVGGEEAGETRIQESVYAGVWRVLRTVGDVIVEDAIEVGRVPAGLVSAAAADAGAAPERLAPPPMVLNGPMVLTEIEDGCENWRPGADPHVVNLTLLPLEAPDIGYIDHHLGTGRVSVLSRGYGNCRITNTRRPNVWRVVYYNSQDAVILNTVEITGVPEAACAAPVDLEDSLERLRDVLNWVEGVTDAGAAA